MSQKQLQRIKLVANAVSGGLKVSEAAELLRLSERQVARLKGRATGEAVVKRKVEVAQHPDDRLLVYWERCLLMEQAAPPDRPVRALDMQHRSAPRKKKPVRIYNLGGRPATRL